MLWDAKPSRLTANLGGTSKFLSLQQNFVVAPIKVTEGQPDIGVVGCFLDDSTILNPPNAARQLLKTAVSDHLTPQATVNGVVDMLKEVPVNFLVNAADDPFRLQSQP